MGRRRYSDDDIRAAVELVDAGFSWEEAARRNSIDKMSLHRRARKLGIGRRGAKPAAFEQRVKLPTSFEDRIYLACLVDTEGCIGIYRRCRDAVSITVTNTHEPVMRWLEAMGGNLYEHKRNERHKTCWTWQLQGRRDVLALLQCIAPHLRIKRGKADEAMAFLHARGVISEVDWKNSQTSCEAHSGTPEAAPHRSHEA